MFPARDAAPCLAPSRAFTRDSVTEPAASDPLLAFREEFPILAQSTYLVSNSLGAMPRAVPAHLAEYARLWGERGVRAWAEGWWRMPEAVGDVVAPLLGAQAGEVVMVPTVTQAMSTVLSALDYPAGRNRVVMTALDFPSVRYAFDALAPRLGADVVVVPSEDGIGIATEAILAAIDERTRLVAISHVFFRSAFIADAAAIVRRAHEVGALVALDAYHSVGVIPVDVHALGADFLAGGVLKWLCGGPGGAFLYVAPSVRDRFAPAITGWQAHRAPFAFAPAMDYADGIWRWLGGTPAVPALFAGVEGPRLVHAAGMDAVRAKSVRQTTRLIALADERGWRVHAPRDASVRGGTVAFDVPHAAEVAQALLARDVVIDYRPGAGIRVAPHFYTTDAEVDHVADAIDEILAAEAWRPYAGRPRTVT
jgi:kynureninase